MKKSEKLTTYAQVCAIEGVDPILSLPFPNAETDEEKALNGVAQTWRIIRVFNKGQKPDFQQLRPIEILSVVVHEIRSRGWSRVFVQRLQLRPLDLERRCPPCFSRI